MYTVAEIEKILLENGFDEPLVHGRGTMTGARYSGLLSWDDWRNNDYGDLGKIYAILGIYEGNGGWIQDAYAYDKNLDEELVKKWDSLVEEILEKIDSDDYFVYEDEENETEI